VFRSWVLPFEVLSLLLLAALVGAIVLSRRDISPEVVAEPGHTGRSVADAAAHAVRARALLFSIGIYGVLADATRSSC
jgi:hypothetical protein